LLGGSFDNGADVDIDIEGEYSQSGGTFYAGSLNVIFGDQCQIAGGVFDAETALLVFEASANLWINGGTLSAGSATIDSNCTDTSHAIANLRIPYQWGGKR